MCKNEKTNIVYMPKENFNNVLFLLREPHSDEDDESSFEGNKKWFVKISSENNSSRYRNRFDEMLASIGKCCLLNSAFTNIKLSGGGANASKEYWKISNEDKKIIFDDIIEYVKPECVFTCLDIFKCISKYSSNEDKGLKYGNGRQLKSCCYKGIHIYAIYHPSRSTKILIDQA